MVEPTPLIGRGPEADHLDRAIADAAEGRGGLLLVIGEEGVGKSALVSDRLRATSLAVVTGRARAPSSPYGALAGAARECLRRVPGWPAGDPRLAHALAVVLPELGEARGGTSPEAVGEAFASLLGELAGRCPVALVLEDLQSADPSTCELLPVLAERTTRVAVLTFAVARLDELPPGHALRGARHELRRAGLLREVPLGRLSVEQVAELLARLLGRPVAGDLAGAITERTGGVPAVVVQLVSAIGAGRLQAGDREALDHTLPDALVEAVEARVARLDAGVVAQLEAAAVLGLELAPDDAAALAGGPAGAVLEARGLVLTTDGGRARFRHPLARDAVRARLSLPRRRALEAAAATLAETRAAPPLVAAEHWLAAGERAHARDALVAAAEQACAARRWRDSAAAAARALELWDDEADVGEREALLERLARCSEVSGQLARAADAWRELLSGIDETEALRCAEASRALAAVLELQGVWPDAERARARAAECFEEAGQAGEAAAEHLACARQRSASLRLEAGLNAARRAAELGAGGVRPDVEARALALAGNLMAMQGRVDAALESVQRGLSVALEHNLVEVASDAYRRLASVREFTADYPGAREAYTVALDYCRSRGEDVQASVCLGCMSWVLFQTGEWARAREVCGQVVRSSDSPPGSRAAALCTLGLIRAFRGEARPAGRALAQALELGRRHAIVAVEIGALWGQAVVAHHAADAGTCRACCLAALERWEATEDRHDAIPVISWAASRFAETGRNDELARCVRALATIAAASPTAESQAALSQAFGEAALMSGHADEAAVQLGRALALLDRVELPLMTCLALIAAAGGARARRELDAARSHLDRAARLARRLGARPLGAHIGSARAALRDGPRGERPPIPAASLTGRQLEVARLLGEGLTNKEIARRLGRSPRTVDMHVANVLARLDCRTRAQAASRLAKLGLQRDADRPLR